MLQKAPMRIRKSGCSAQFATYSQSVRWYSVPSRQYVRYLPDAHGRYIAVFKQDDEDEWITGSRDQNKKPCWFRSIYVCTPRIEGKQSIEAPSYVRHSMRWDEISVPSAHRITLRKVGIPTGHGPSPVIVVINRVCA